MPGKDERKQMMDAYRQRKVVGGVFAIVNKGNGKRLLESTRDMKGSINKFEFMVKTGISPELRLAADFKAFGADSFAFEVLEELEKGETQTLAEFHEDVKTLLELWRQKFDPAALYL